MSKPMQVDEKATAEARATHEHGMKMLDAIWSYDRTSGTTTRAKWAAAWRLQEFRAAMFRGSVARRGGPQKHGTIKSGSWDPLG